MDTKEMKVKVNSVLLCMMAHPDNEPNSEFADRIDDLLSIHDALSEPTTDANTSNKATEPIPVVRQCCNAMCNDDAKEGSVYCEFHGDM